MILFKAADKKLAEIGMMSIYEIDFVSAAGENLQTVWLGHTESVALMIKDVCGMYPAG